ncbi:hypothetical protein EV426DRAFT_580627 [Tirmania nivea]|nr:hypothetical protein EV426DRAFT_580627 [Tirmania nivea]
MFAPVKIVYLHRQLSPTHLDPATASSNATLASGSRKDYVNFPTLLYSPRSHLAPTTPLNPVFFTSCIASDTGLVVGIPWTTNAEVLTFYPEGRGHIVLLFLVTRGPLVTFCFDVAGDTTVSSPNLPSSFSSSYPDRSSYMSDLSSITTSSSVTPSFFCSRDFICTVTSSSVCTATSTCSFFSSLSKTSD